MDTLSAFAMGMATRGSPIKVFDWKRAAQLIRDRKPRVASAFLAGDRGCTGGEIYRDGSPVPKEKTYTYLASTWATPTLDMDGDEIACFTSEDSGWGSGTYWPAEALAVLNGEVA